MQGTSQKKPSRKIKLLLILSVALCGFSLLLYYSSQWINSKPVKMVYVSGNALIPAEEIINQIDTISHAANGILISVKSKVKENPYVKNTIISHKHEDELNIEIKEKNPIAAVITESGDVVLIDDEMMILPFKNYRNCSNLPVLRGLFNFGNIDSLAFNGFFEILSFIKNSKNNILIDLVSEIIFDRIHQSYSMTLTDNGVKVQLGTAENMEDKINIFSDYLIEKLGGTNFSKVEYVDLRWKNMLAVRVMPEQAIVNK